MNPKVGFAMKNKIGSTEVTLPITTEETPICFPYTDKKGRMGPKANLKYRKVSKINNYYKNKEILIFTCHKAKIMNLNRQLFIIDFHFCFFKFVHCSSNEPLKSYFLYYLVKSIVIFYDSAF